jgi:hypothetical protein
MKGNAMPFPFRPLYVLLSAAALAVLSGCAPLNLKKSLPWPLASEDKPQQPQRVTPIWTDTVLYHPDRPPERGFGGRLFFYGGQGDKPVKVDGTLVVYAFDEAGRDPSNTRPDRKYVFPKDVFDMHYSESAIGHSYSVWIPWDKVGGEQKQISLIVRFLPAQGAPVVSEMTKHLLPGKPVEHAGTGLAAASAGSIPPGYAPPTAERQVRPVSYDAPINPPGVQLPTEGDLRGQRMSVTTINIAPRFGQPRPVASVVPHIVQQKAALLRREIAQPVVTGQPVGSPAVSPPQARPMGTVPAPQEPPPPQARFSPERPQVPGASLAVPMRDRSPWPQRPATWPFDPGAEPGAAIGPQSAATATAARSAYY